jgi:uncharacterized protein YhbP (UPF0306 family)
MKNNKVMDSQQNLETIARNIIDSILYMVLGTADEQGQPWVSPGYFSSEKYREFYWMSSPEVRHSRNILVRPQLSIVIFDSRVAAGLGQAVYMSATAEELSGDDFNRGIQIYNGRFPNPAEREESGVRLITSEDVQAPGLYRLYRAIAQEHWVLDPAGHPDHRTPVTL